MAKRHGRHSPAASYKQAPSGAAPEFLGAAKAIHDGLIGKVTRVEMSVNFQEERWHKDLTNVRQEDVDWKGFELHGRIPPTTDPRRLLARSSTSNRRAKGRGLS